VTGVRSGRMHRHKAKQSLALSELGFVWDPSQRGSEQLLSALRAYKQLHSHVDVPRDYVVPCEAPFDRETWGMKLGLKVANLLT